MSHPLSLNMVIHGKTMPEKSMEQNQSHGKEVMDGMSCASMLMMKTTWAPKDDE